MISLRRQTVLADIRHGYPIEPAPLVRVGRSTAVQTGKIVDVGGYGRAGAAVGVGLFGTAAYFLFKSGHWIWGSVFVLLGSWSVPTLLTGKGEDYT